MSAVPTALGVFSNARVVAGSLASVGTRIDLVLGAAYDEIATVRIACSRLARYRDRSGNGASSMFEGVVRESGVTFPGTCVSNEENRMTEPVAIGPVEGHCLCGAITVRVAHAGDARPGACHCRMCQRWSGALFVCFAAPAEAVSVSGEVARHASSDFAERAFCPTCGSHLWMRDTNVPDAEYELMPGLFDAARDWPLQSEIYADRAFTSVRLAGEHRRVTRADWEAEHPSVEGES